VYVGGTFTNSGTTGSLSGGSVQSPSSVALGVVDGTTLNQQVPLNATDFAVLGVPTP
jgi:hypothetical protein